MAERHQEIQNIIFHSQAGASFHSLLPVSWSEVFSLLLRILLTVKSISKHMLKLLTEEGMSLISNSEVFIRVMH